MVTGFRLSPFRLRQMESPASAGLFLCGFGADSRRAPFATLAQKSRLVICQPGWRGCWQANRPAATQVRHASFLVGARPPWRRVPVPTCSIDQLP